MCELEKELGVVLGGWEKGQGALLKLRRPEISRGGFPGLGGGWVQRKKRGQEGEVAPHSCAAPELRITSPSASPIHCVTLVGPSLDFSFLISKWGEGVWTMGFLRSLLRLN